MNLSILSPIVVIFLAIGLLVYFVIRYAIPAQKIRKRISLTTQELKKLKIETSSVPISKEAVAKIMSIDTTLAHLWSEYEETLHDQHSVNPDGERIISQIRATVPSEVFFNTQVIVDTPIQAEFFRHLPGILTGIGIIGTFAGLLVGLADFKTGDVSLVNHSVETLLGSVWDAFIASAVAISVAMVVTFAEKRLITKCYKEVEELTQAIDALYEAGAGEEYLARIVKSSEEGATQTRLLKDSLVEDLKQMMTELVESQIKSSVDNNRYLAEHIGTAITTNFQEPLRRLSSAVERTQGDQTDAFKGTLQDLLSAYTETMRENFGDQISNLNNVMTESVRSLNSMQAGFEKLVCGLDNAGRNTSEAMGVNLAKMLEQVELQQHEMRSQMSSFADQIRTQVLQTQSASHEQISQTIETFSSQMATFFADFKIQRQGMALEEEICRNKANEETQKFVGSLENGLNGFISQMNLVVISLNENIHVLNNVALKAVEEVNSNVSKMNLVAISFTDSGNTLSNVLNQGNNLFDKLVRISMALEHSSKTVQDAVSAYERTRNSVEQMTLTLGVIVKDADARAGVSRDILVDMRSFSDRFSELQVQTDKYLDEVSDILIKNFDSFGDSVVRNIEKTNAALVKSLSEAVGMLSASIQELDEKLEGFNDTLDKVVKIRG